MLRSLSLSILGLATTLALAAPGFAAKRSFDIPTAAMTPMMGATDSGAIFFPNTGTPRARMALRLPVDYRAGSTVRVTLFFFADQACAAALSLANVSRGRAGNAYIDDTAGVTFVNGGLLSLQPGVIASKTIEIRPAAAFPGQKPGDLFFILLQRDTAEANDTCASFMALLHADVRYTLK